MIVVALVLLVYSAGLTFYVYLLRCHLERSEAIRLDLEEAIANEAMEKVRRGEEPFI